MLKVIDSTSRIEDIDPEARQERPTLETIVEDIADDARREPLAYLRETRVPEGGE